MRAIIQHLRFPFSILLLPIFLFALSTLENYNKETALLLFFILHFLIYPSSNAFNSLQDKDEGSIGLIKNPLKVPPALQWISLAMDGLALMLCFYISFFAFIAILIYILGSRLYSWRKIRLKQYPILSYLAVGFFQGSWIYLSTQIILSLPFNNIDWILVFTSFCFIASIYPLSQIYQHEQDAKDGIISFSHLIGKQNTFYISGFFFVLALTLLSWHFASLNQYKQILILFICTSPSAFFYLYWINKFFKNKSMANFVHSMKMSIFGSLGLNIFFLIQI